MNIFKRLYRTVLTHLTDKEFSNDITNFVLIIIKLKKT